MKQKYYVYKEETQQYTKDFGTNTFTRELVGETYAVSAAQAVNNYVYRNNIDRRGLHCSGMYGYERNTRYFASVSRLKTA